MMRHNLKFRIFSTLLVIMGLFIAGCSNSIPKDSALEKNWGRAYETQRYKQIANPEAGQQEAEEPAPIDGTVADAAANEYRKSFGEEGEKETVGYIELKNTN